MNGVKMENLVKTLIVEDNDCRIESFKDLLGESDYSIVKSADEAIRLLNINHYDYIFLDHDLGIDPRTGDKTDNVMLESGDGTGYQVAQIIAKKNINKVSRIIIHTFNIVGAMRMKEILPNSHYYPFGTNEFIKVLDFIGSGKVKGT